MPTNMEKLAALLQSPPEELLKQSAYKEAIRLFNASSPEECASLTPEMAGKLTVLLVNKNRYDSLNKLASAVTGSPEARKEIFNAVFNVVYRWKPQPFVSMLSDMQDDYTSIADLLKNNLISHATDILKQGKSQEMFALFHSLDRQNVNLGCSFQDLCDNAGIHVAKGWANGYLTTLACTFQKHGVCLITDSSGDERLLEACVKKQELLSTRDAKSIKDLFKEIASGRTNAPDWAVEQTLFLKDSWQELKGYDRPFVGGGFP